MQSHARNFISHHQIKTKEKKQGLKQKSWQMWLMALFTYVKRHCWDTIYFAESLSHLKWQPLTADFVVILDADWVLSHMSLAIAIKTK